MHFHYEIQSKSYRFSRRTIGWHAFRANITIGMCFPLSIQYSVTLLLRMFVCMYGAKLAGECQCLSFSEEGPLMGPLIVKGRKSVGVSLEKTPLRDAVPHFP